MTTPEQENSPPDTSDDDDAQMEADAEAFANDWVETKGKVDSLYDFMQSFMGNDRDEQPPAARPTPQPRHTTRKQIQKAPGETGTALPSEQPGRQPDTKPEESHWYWKPRWTRGK